MKQAIVIGVSCLIISCSIFQFGEKSSVLYGQEWCKEPYFTCMQIELRKNGKFELFHFMDIGGRRMWEGTWKLSTNDTILLNTYEQPHIPRSYYKGYNPNPNRDSVLISVRDFEIPLHSASIMINDREQLCIATEGYCTFKVDEVKNIEVSYVSSRPIKIDVIDQGYEKIEVVVKDGFDGLFPEFFTDLKVVRKENKVNVIFYEDHIFNLERMDIEHKQWK